MRVWGKTARGTGQSARLRSTLYTFTLSGEGLARPNSTRMGFIRCGLGCAGGGSGFREVYAVDFVPLAGEACGTLRSCERPFESERGGPDIGEDEIACEGRACAL
jgi:hypothetical protein